MIALDKMSPEERKSFVKRGLEEIAEGRTEEDLKRTREMDADVIEKVTSEGMKAYFQKASADTKMDLAPLMEAMNDIMQGMRGQKFGPPQ
jgi:flagellar motor component MotA